MTHLEDESKEHPDVIAGLLRRENHTVHYIVTAIKNFDPQLMMIVARGTSDNAAHYAQYRFDTLTSLPLALTTSSLHTMYETRLFLEDSNQARR